MDCDKPGETEGSGDAYALYLPLPSVQDSALLSPIKRMHSLAVWGVAHRH